MRKEKKKHVSDVATANSLDNCQQTVYIVIVNGIIKCKMKNGLMILLL